MAKLTLTYPNFSLTSYWNAKIINTGVVLAGNTVYRVQYSTPTYAKKTLLFRTSQIPEGTTLTAATLYCTFGGGGTAQLDGTRVAEKDVLDKFTSMNGGTFSDIEVNATFRAYGNDGVGEFGNGCTYSASCSFKDISLVLSYASAPNLHPSDPDMADVSPQGAITLYAQDATNFASNGLGILTPTTCEVSETLNGDWSLKLEHPIDGAGKWRRIQLGCIIKAPVPSAYTPSVKYSTGAVDIYKTTARLNLRSGKSTSTRSLGVYAKGKQCVVLDASDPAWFRVTAPDGKLGYFSSTYLEYVETKTSAETAADAVNERAQLRDQPFRVYRIVPSLESVTVYARHIFYDLADNMIMSYAPALNATGRLVAGALLANCLSDHEFTIACDLTTTAGESDEIDTDDDFKFENVNPTEALLGDGGFVSVYGGELARDWWDVYVVQRVGDDTHVVIRQGKNLTGITYDVDATNVVTRIMPVGSTKKGDKLYLDGTTKYVDSPHISDYSTVKWYTLDVKEAKVSDKLNTTKARAKLREAAQKEFDNGCDLPKVTLNVDFVNVCDTAEYAQYAPLANIYLGDTVRVITERLNLDTRLRMTEYTYDCIGKKYTKMTLGDVDAKLADSTISGKQIASGSITSSKLGFDSVGAGQLKDGSVSNLHIQNAAIETAHIADAAITTAKIADAQIISAKIEDAAITTAKIGDAQITNAKIADATIDKAKIKDFEAEVAAISELHAGQATIGDLSVTTAKIADLAVTTAKINDLSVESAKIASAAITAAKIADLAVTSAKIALLAVQTANIGDLAVTAGKIADATITAAKIADATITTAKIADASITTAKIDGAAIGTAQIALGAITQALIANGAIGTAQIADASITEGKIVSLSANSITAGTLSVERLVIVGSDKSVVFAVNSANGTEQLSQSTIDGGALTQRTITADRIVAGAITADEIAAATIVANNIASGAITADKIAANAIEARHIKAGSITTSQLAANVGETLNLSSNTAIEFVYNRAKEYADGAVDTANTYINAIQGYQRFTSDGLELGVLNSAFKAMLGNTKLSFLQDGREIAYISNNKLYITQAHVTESLGIGTVATGGVFYFRKTQGGLAIMWGES